MERQGKVEPRGLGAVEFFIHLKISFLRILFLLIFFSPNILTACFCAKPEVDEIDFEYYEEIFLGEITFINIFFAFIQYWSAFPVILSLTTFLKLISPIIIIHLVK